MKYKQNYFGGASQEIVINDNLPRTVKNNFFGGKSQEITLWDQENKPKVSGAILTAVGKTQISTDNGVTWLDSFAADFLKVDSVFDFLVRTNPADVVAADDGTYEYDFTIGGAPDLNIANVKRDQAQVTGQISHDQQAATVGTQLLINTTVKDKSGTAKLGTAIFADWVAGAATTEFKTADGTATLTEYGTAVALVASAGMKTIIATDDADAPVAGAAVALVVASDSSKLGVALNADGKTVEMTPVAGAKGKVWFKITAAGYKDLAIAVTLS